MKTFEEKFTAWVDGELKGAELAVFEAELAKVDDADLDRVVTRQLGDLLREHGKPPELSNADFFNDQIMQRIEAEMPPQPEAKPRRAWFSWSLPSLGLAGAFSLLVAFTLYHYMIPTGPQQSPALADEPIISTYSGDPTITASAFYSKQNDVTVLWLDGSKYMSGKQRPAEEKRNEKAQK